MITYTKYDCILHLIGKKQKCASKNHPFFWRIKKVIISKCIHNMKVWNPKKWWEIKVGYLFWIWITCLVRVCSGIENIFIVNHWEVQANGKEMSIGFLHFWLQASSETFLVSFWLLITLIFTLLTSIVLFFSSNLFIRKIYGFVLAVMELLLLRSGFFIHWIALYPPY